MNKTQLIPSNYIEVKGIIQTQMLLKKMLEDFHKICEENGLIYNVFGGTMLGAVRHKGFIPWDDDVDVTMPRDDYEKFMMLDLADTKYEVRHFPKKGYVYPYMKFCLKESILIEEDLIDDYCLLGLYIDVFPVDGYPIPEKENDHFKRRKKIKQKRCLACMRAQPSPKAYKKIFFPIRFLQHVWYSCRGVDRYLEKEIEFAKEYSFEESLIISCYGAGWGAKGKLEKEYYLDRVLVDFEDIKVWSIKHYDIHLKRLYGDYMQLPPEKKRKSNHNYILYVSSELL